MKIVSFITLVIFALAQNVSMLSEDFSISHISSGTTIHIDSISLNYVDVFQNIVDTSNWTYDDELSHYYYKEVKFEGGNIILSVPELNSQDVNFESISISSDIYSFVWENMDIRSQAILVDSLFFGYKEEVLNSDRIKRFSLMDAENGVSTDYSLSVFLNDSCFIQKILISSN